MTFAIDFLQVLILVGTAPLLRGLVGRIKARIQNRRGASVWRPYADLRKLFSKEDLIPATASPLFRLCPMILFAATVAAAAFVPTLHGFALLGTAGDFIVLVYLLALARFFLILGAMDGGSSFGGMGASREALVSTLGGGAASACAGCGFDRGAQHERGGNRALVERPAVLSSFAGTCARRSLPSPWSPSRKPAGFQSTIRPRTWNSR